MICNNNGADQPAHRRSLISNFVVCFLDESYLHLLREKFQFLASLFSRRDWFKTRFVGNPEDRFSRVVACVACSTALGQILQVQQIILLKKIWGGFSSDILTGVTLFDCALHRLIHKSFVSTAHRARERRGLWFPGCGSLVRPCTNSANARLGRGYKWLVRIFFRLYALIICYHAPAQRNVEDSDFVSAVPHSNHHTVGTASWQNHDSSPLQSVIILHCHVCLGLSNPYISSALWRKCKSKNAAHLPGHGYPRPAQGLGEAVVTNDWCILYSL